MDNIKTSITKSRSGHYTVTLTSKLHEGRLLIVRKLGSLYQARAVLEDIRISGAAGLECRISNEYHYAIHNSNVRFHLQLEKEIANV
jgi:hypothetical protein